MSRAGLGFIDLSPLRASRGFRLLYAARAASFLAFGVLGVAVSLQMYTLTGSSLQVARTRSRSWRTTCSRTPARTFPPSLRSPEGMSPTVPDDRPEQPGVVRRCS